MRAEWDDFIFEPSSRPGFLFADDLFRKPLRTFRYRALFERVVDRVGDRAGFDIHQQQVRSVAHPLEAGRRRIEAKRGPVGIIVSRRQEQRRQYGPDGPAPVAPAGRIKEGRKVDAIEGAAVPRELMAGKTGAAWVRAAKSRAARTGMRSAGACMWPAWAGVRSGTRMWSARAGMWAGTRSAMRWAARMVMVFLRHGQRRQSKRQRRGDSNDPQQHAYYLCFRCFQSQGTPRGRHYQTGFGGVSPPRRLAKARRETHP